MKIIVPIKQILDPQGLTFRRDKERMFVNVEEYIIGPASKAAIEAALRLKGEDDQVLALSVGPPRADDALREALALAETWSEHRWPHDLARPQLECRLSRALEQRGDVGAALTVA